MSWYQILHDASSQLDSPDHYNRSWNSQTIYRRYKNSGYWICRHALINVLHEGPNWSRQTHHCPPMCWETERHSVGLLVSWNVLPGRIQEHPSIPKLYRLSSSCIKLRYWGSKHVFLLSLCLFSDLFGFLRTCIGVRCRLPLPHSLSHIGLSLLTPFQVDILCLAVVPVIPFIRNVSLPALRPLAEHDHRNSLIADMMIWELPAWVSANTTVSDIPGIGQSLSTVDWVAPVGINLIFSCLRHFSQCVFFSPEIMMSGAAVTYTYIAPDDW